MTTRQIIEIVCLGLVCGVSVWRWFWTGPARNIGIVLGLVVFVALAAFIAYH